MKTVYSHSITYSSLEVFCELRDRGLVPFDLNPASSSAGSDGPGIADMPVPGPHLVRFLPGGWAEHPDRSEAIEPERWRAEPVRFGDDRGPGVAALQEPDVDDPGAGAARPARRAGAAS